jgi:hypothetical protein
MLNVFAAGATHSTFPEWGNGQCASKIMLSLTTHDCHTKIMALVLFEQRRTASTPNLNMRSHIPEHDVIRCSGIFHIRPDLLFDQEVSSLLCRLHASDGCQRSSKEQGTIFAQLPPSALVE